MHIDRKNINSYQLTLSAYELATFMSSLRWIADEAKGELTSEAIENARAVILNYDKALKELNKDKPVRG